MKINYKGKILFGESLHDEWKSRKDKYIWREDPPGSTPPDDWEIDKEYKTKIKSKQLKDPGKMLEDRVWQLLYNAGCTSLNSRPFLIDDSGTNREIDIIAADENFVFYCECKYRGGKPSRWGNFESEISKLVKRKELIFKFNKQHFQGKKPIFCFITENILLDKHKTDIKYAEKNKVKVFDEYDIDAMKNLVKIAGEGARYQFLNRILQGESINNLSIEIPALKGKMGGNTFYSFLIEPDHLLKIAYVHQRKKNKFEEIADSYQRIINPSRIRSIENFIDNQKGFFPNSIIVNFQYPLKTNEMPKTSKSNLHTSSKPVWLKIPPKFGSAWIIDGQHRLYSYANSALKNKELLSVVAFDKNVPGFQTKIFMDINTNQQNISANLKWDLYDDLYSASNDSKEIEFRVISKIVKKLYDDGVFKYSIKIPSKGDKGHIGFASFAQSIKDLGFVIAEGPFYKEDINERVNFCFERINTFWEVIKDVFNDEWNKKTDHFIFHNSGIIVFHHLLNDWLYSVIRPDAINNHDKFQKIIKKQISLLKNHIDSLSDDDLNIYKQGNRKAILSKIVVVLIKEVFKKDKYKSDFYDNYVNKEEDIRKSRSPFDLLKEGEGQKLEIKGQVKWDIGKKLNIGKWSRNDDLLAEICKTITSFLNSNNGTIIIGALEKDKWQELLDKNEWRYINQGDYSVIGINNELEQQPKGDRQQKFTQDIITKLMSSLEPQYPDKLIETQIANIPDSNLKLFTIWVEKSPGKSGYYFNKKFYVRRGDADIPLEPHKINDYKLGS
jgi:DNA sulfur modification protein DndB